MDQEMGNIKEQKLQWSAVIDPVGGEIFRNYRDWLWGPPGLLYNEYWVFSGGKERPGCDADPSPPSSAVVKKE